MAFVKRDIEEIVAGMRAVQRPVENLAERIGVRAEANLRAHYNEGDTEIDLVQAPKKKDWMVVLVDEGGAAGAIERGGTRRNGTPFEGLHILGRAVRGA